MADCAHLPLHAHEVYQVKVIESQRSRIPELKHPNKDTQRVKYHVYTYENVYAYFYMQK